MTAYFISDLHLSEETPQIYEAFKDFLTRLQAGDDLYILGDFFDAWIGDDEDAPFALEVKETLRRLTQRGVTGYMLPGNRDFLLGETFCRETGLTLLPEEHVITLNGERVLLMHGDSLCTDDTEYMKFRQMVRNPAWQAQVLALPLAQRRAMAAQLRQQSKSLNAMKAEDIMDVNQREVEARMEYWGVSRLIHGHTHRPCQHTFKIAGATAERWVLGDWDQQYWWLIGNDQLTLKEACVVPSLI
ncbi:MAG TPA: UDP-2,3-diacylglucosamine diphosphatase [Cellvibrionaceae bacterium]|nr:UDP-2,3-diacylglucosamine diphosphatase [Cellvibrionaceae bacterium]